ncbi:hypothetical protein WA026_015041 [Henosepilachna vigintioctopunctata]|uniref:Peroxisomal ATPase PEX6 n=1 Tax=Henosepilachna vigintioctopunctata TaxID=420089 RepID=A0AAW1U2M5_9CUCU
MKLNYLEVLLADAEVKFLIGISKLLFPRYPFHFCLYIFVKYYEIRRRQRSYSIKILKTELIEQIAKLSNENIIDNNYSVLVNNKYMKGIEYAALCVKYRGKMIYRYVRVVQTHILSENTIGISYPLIFNITNSSEMKYYVDVDTRKMTAQIKCIKEIIDFADQVHLSLVNSTNDIENKEIDIIVRNYFSKPKLVHESDIIEINMDHYCEGYPWNLTKITNIARIVHFKCKKVSAEIVQRNEFQGYFVVLGETAVEQSNNIQSFIPPCFEIHPGLKECTQELNTEQEAIGICPYGLEKYCAQIEQTIRPFLQRKYEISPAFLLIGKKGSGKEILISSICSKYGLHFYKITNFDITAQLYAQNEIKIKNAFTNAKHCAPCIIYIENFENFEKNNENQSDDRLISHFAVALNYLFENNEYPVILFCSSNEESISPKLKRQFVEIIKINALTVQERMRSLEWLLKYNNISYEGDLQELASRTNVSLFKDLKALVDKAINFNLSHEKRSVLDMESVSSALDYMQLQYNKNINTPTVPKVQWEDIGGLSEVKREIIETINFPLKFPDIFSSSGLRRFGILLFGPPGTGKTLLAKAVATECNLCFLSVKGPELLNMYIGQSEENIREVFERARSAAPCIIFFDELDSLAPNRGAAGDSGGVMDRVVSQLLAEMDGLNEKATIFMIGATNRPDLIDPALLRPGRFDKLLYVGPSMDFNSRLSVLKALTRKFKFAKDVKLENIISICPENISGADFYGICANAWTHAIGRFIERNNNGVIDIKNMTGKDVEVGYEDFKSALKSVQPSVSLKDLLYFEKLRKEIASNK